VGVTVTSNRAGRRPAAFVAAVMLLLLLAAGELFSSGVSAHGPHDAGRIAATVQTPCWHDHSGDQAPAHEHGSGDARAANPAPRGREDGDTSGVLMPVTRTGPAPVTGARPAPAAAGACDPDPTRSGVLRI
jgi:hypothetical protein